VEGHRIIGEFGACRFEVSSTIVRKRSTVTPLAAFAFCGLIAVSGCGSDTPPAAEPSSQAGSTAPVAPVSSPLPVPAALVDVLARLSDPAATGSDKISLVELATADDAAALDKFGKALADNGALPLTFDAVDLKWSETEVGNVVATVNVTTANKPPGKFSFPMEFTPIRDGWQLTRKTANLLLEFGEGATATSPPP
jgi:hypothetical protein